MSQPTTPAEPPKIQLTQHDTAPAQPKAKAKRAGCVCDCGDCPCNGELKPGDPTIIQAKQSETDASE